jgi:hypothetical protein
MDAVKGAINGAKDALNPFAAITDFLDSLKDMVGDLVEIIKKTAALIRDPFKNLVNVITAIIGFAMYALLRVLYIIYSVPGIYHVIVFSSYFFWTRIVSLILIATIYMAIFAGIALVTLALSIIDVISSILMSTTTSTSTAGIISYLTRCENPIDNWYNQPNYVFDNINQRFIIAQTTCASRYKPNSFFCQRQHDTEPSYCPQAQIFRIYLGLPVYDPWIIDKYEPGRSFYQSSPSDREKMLRDYFQRRQKFLQTCHDKTEPYRHIVRSICANYDKVNLAREDQRTMLPQLCKQVFCQGGFPEPYCKKLDNSGPITEYPQIQDIVFNIARYAAYTLVVIIILVFFLRQNIVKPAINRGGVNSE